MGARQLVLDLPARPALGREDFFVSAPNRVALAQVESWPDWPGGRLAVAGPEGSGKTHLAHVWARRAGAWIVPAAALPGLALAELAADAALAVEDADRIGGRPGAEEMLFHVCNHLGAGGGSLMVSGRLPPAQWRIALPDLASRLSAAPVARLEPPDDALLAAVLVKLFADRQLAVAPGLIRYLVGRMDRSFAAAEALVGALDRAGLARHRPLAPRLAAEVLRDDRATAAPDRGAGRGGCGARRELETGPLRTGARPAAGADLELFATELLATAPDGEAWVFAYGSLIWNPGFRFAEERTRWRSAGTGRSAWAGTSGSAGRSGGRAHARAGPGRHLSRRRLPPAARHRRGGRPRAGPPESGSSRPRFWPDGSMSGPGPEPCGGDLRDDRRRPPTWGARRRRRSRTPWPRRSAVGAMASTCAARRCISRRAASTTLWRLQEMVAERWRRIRPVDEPRRLRPPAAVIRLTRSCRMVCPVNDAPEAHDAQDRRSPGPRSMPIS